MLKFKKINSITFQRRSMLVIIYTILSIINYSHSVDDKLERYKPLSYATKFYIKETKQTVILAIKNTSSNKNFSLKEKGGEYTLDIHEGLCNFLLVDEIKDETTKNKVSDKEKALRDDLEKAIKDAKDKSYIEKLKLQAEFHKKSIQLHKSNGTKTEKFKCPKFTAKQMAIVKLDSTQQKKIFGMDIDDKFVIFEGNFDGNKTVKHSMTISLIIDKDENAVSLTNDMAVDFTLSFDLYNYSSKIMIDAFEDIIEGRNGSYGRTIAVVVLLLILLVVVVLVVKKVKK